MTEPEVEMSHCFTYNSIYKARHHFGRSINFALRHYSKLTDTNSRIQMFFALRGGIKWKHIYLLDPLMESKNGIRTRPVF